MPPPRCLVLCVFLVVLWGDVAVEARREYVARIPNGDNVLQAHALGHIAWDGGGPLNAFGDAFEAAGNVWTKALCQGDADGDGQTNGEELGDPCCTWSQGDKPLETNVLSHPGDFGSKLNTSDLRSRVHKCLEPAATTRAPHNDTSSSSSHTHLPSPNVSNSSSSRGADSTVREPTTAVPTPTTLSASSSRSFGRVPWHSSFTVVFLVVFFVHVVT